jgi:DHA1 family bicyclomycin/chloramphenicol resistance-like MFS transporter
VILDDVYGYGAWFPLFFGAVAVLLAINSLNNARLVSRLGVVRLVRGAAVLGVCAALALAVLSFATDGHPNFWLFSLALCVVIPTVQGLTPAANSIAMSPLPHVAGTASAIIATVTAAGGAILGGIASDAFDGTVQPFSLYVLAYLTIAAGFVMWGTSRSSHNAPNRGTFGETPSHSEH